MQTVFLLALSVLPIIEQSKLLNKTILVMQDIEIVNRWTYTKFAIF